MNRNRYWNQNMSNRKRGSFNRGGRGGNRGWLRNQGGQNGPNVNFPGFRGGYRFQQPQSMEPWKKKQQREKRDSPGKRLTEDLIGVTEYISDHEGFNGIIKSRYSDFQVSEMNEKGEFAKLTTTKPPEPPSDDTVDEDEDLLLHKYNLEILPMETWDKINSLTVNTNNVDEKVEIDMEGVTKEQRTKIHDAVKKAFGDSIVGSTVNVGDKKFMRFQKYRKGVRIDNRVKWVWPGEYVYFVVHKQNCDTMDAAVRIAEKLGMQVRPSTLGYAGTKDRRAKTSQWFTVRRVDPRRVAKACSQLKDIHVGNYSFGDHGLKLGMLKGNRFRIALRNVTADDQTVDAACESLRQKGFINYYGLQRFGTRVDTPTYSIGLALLQGNYAQAIDGILEAREGPLEQALLTYQQCGAAAALHHLPWRVPHAAHSEARLLRALAAAPHDRLGALSKLPRNMRLLYLHAYQSLIWNRAVSERIRRFGLRPVAGDCVPLDDVPLEAIDGDQSDSEEDGEGGEDTKIEDDQDAKNETNENVKDEDIKIGADENVQTNEKLESTNVESNTKDKSEVTDGKRKSKKKKKEIPKPVAIKILTQEDVNSGNYSLFNIVLPLPGAFIEYPPNMVDFYEEILAKDGLKLNLKHKIKSYSLCGAYRHVAVAPQHVAWRAVRYSDPYGDLLASDKDELDHQPAASTSPPTAIRDDGKYKALLLSMTLPPSCYATMALRELLKVDTSSDKHASMNNYFLDKHSAHKAGGSGTTPREEPEVKGEVGASGDAGEVGASGDAGETGDMQTSQDADHMQVVGASGDVGGPVSPSSQESGGGAEKRKLDEDVADGGKKVKIQ